MRVELTILHFNDVVRNGITNSLVRSLKKELLLMSIAFARVVQ